MAILGALALGTAALVWQHRALQTLRGERAALENRLSLAKEPATKSKRPPSRQPQAANTDAPTEAPADELTRLRAQIAAQKAEIASLKTQIENPAPVPGADSIPFSFMAVSVPKSEWHSAGYDTPEAALQTMLFATLNRDVVTLRSSLTQDELTRRNQKEWKGKDDAQIAEDGAARLANATGFQILKYESSSSNSIHYTVYVDGVPHPEQPLWFGVHKINGQWKCDAPMYHRD